MEILRKFGTATTAVFPTVSAGGMDYRVIANTWNSADSKLIKAGVTAHTCAKVSTIANGFNAMPIKATELCAKRVVFAVVDTTATKRWIDQAFIVSTYGHSGAQHAFDLDSPTVTPATASVSASMQTVLQNYNVASAATPVVPATAGVSAIVQTVIQNANVATANALTTAALSARVIDAVGGGIQLQAVATAGAVATAAVSAMVMNVFQAFAPATAGAVSAKTMDALQAYAPATAGTVSAKATDALKGAILTDPTGPPAWPMSPADALGWMAALSRNKATVSANEIALFDDAGTTVVASASRTDDGVVYTRGEYTG